MPIKFQNIGFALKGLATALKTESHIKMEFSIAFIMTAIGLWFGLTPLEWVIQFGCIALIISFEIVNTAIEELCDMVHPEHHPTIGKIKDMAAAAVLFSAMMTAIIGIIIYYPKVVNLLA